MRNPGRLVTTLVWVVAQSAFALASPPPDYGFDWVTVGSPGNRPTLPAEVPADPDLRVGAVSYDYRIMRTHVSNEQYLEFANAYAPFWQGSPGDITLTGYWGKAVQSPSGSWSYSARPGSEHYAARIEWEMAARLCNWLTNGKVNQAWAFETGAYDLSLAWPDKLTPLPQAKYWMPTLDEYDKAVYYDPNRYGVGQEGYWQNPDSGDESLVVGLPEDGGETIGDLLWQTDPGLGLGGWNLGQYPNVQTPWGLIDVSATAQDFTQSNLGSPGIRIVRGGGSLAGDTVFATWDRLDFDMAISYPSGWGGLRLVSVVPAPYSPMMLLIASMFRRTRRA